MWKSVISPTQGDVHVNRPLTNVSIAFMQSAENFVAGQVFPDIPSGMKSDIFFTYPRGEFNRVAMKLRAPATESAGASYKVAKDNFATEVFALHKDVDDQIRATQDRPINLDMEATRFLSLQGMLKKEIDWADNFFKTGLWSFEADGAAARSANLSLTAAANNNLVYWNNASSSPIEDVDFAVRTVQENTGFRPNVLVLGRPVYDTLKNHADIIGRLDRGQTTGPAIARREALAALFEMDRILIMDGVQNTAAEGVADAHSFIGGKHALLAYVPDSPGILTPASGYSFSWTGYVGAGGMGVRMKRFYRPELSAMRNEIEMAYDMKRVAADLACFFNGIVQ